MGKLLDDSERLLFDVIATEIIELSGEQVNYYGQDIANSVIDPLYGEPSERKYSDPAKLWASVSWPQINPDVAEQGFGFDMDGQVIIARKSFDDSHTAYPFEGDIVEMWRTPFHDSDSLGKGLFFDVIKVQNDGHINDSPSFVQFKLTLKRRTQFGAERKIDPP